MKPGRWFEVFAAHDRGILWQAGQLGAGRPREPAFISCGHRHRTAAEATSCRWHPRPWPLSCDLLVKAVEVSES